MREGKTAVFLTARQQASGFAGGLAMFDVSSHVVTGGMIGRFVSPHPYPLPRGEGTAVAPARTFGDHRCRLHCILDPTVQRERTGECRARFSAPDASPSHWGEGEGSVRHIETVRTRFRAPDWNARLALSLNIGPEPIAGDSLSAALLLSAPTQTVNDVMA